MRLVVVMVANGFEQLDHTGDEAGVEHADGAEIQQIDRTIGANLIVAQMRIAMDHAVSVKRHIPGPKKRLGDGVAFFLRWVLGQTVHQGTAVQPGHRQQPVGAEGRYWHRHMHTGLVVQHNPVEPHLRGFPAVVQFFPQAFAQFLVDLILVDRVVHPLIDRHRQLQLPQVGFDRAGHIGILQLAGDVGAVGQPSTMHLPQAGGGRGLLIERCKFRLPVRTEFAGHPAADEIPAHGGGVGLKLRQLRRVFGRQRVRHGGQKLRDLHQWPLEAAQDGLQVFRVGGPVRLDPEHTLAGHAGGNAADGAGCPSEAAHLAEEVATGHRGATVGSAS